MQLTENIVETDIVTKIKNSTRISQSEKDSFIHLIMYFTPIEIEELRMLI